LATPFLAEIRVFSFNFAPKGWAQCNGQLLPINQNQALFALLGTTYGGDGISTFALPNLQGKTSLHFGNNFSQGNSGGETSHTLVLAEIPQHTHTVVASSNAGNQSSPVGNYFASGNKTAYSTTPNANMAPSAPTGAGQAHDNMSPYLVLNVCIALQGIFPSRN
jgi:microcystin-dependent protein